MRAWMSACRFIAGTSVGQCSLGKSHINIVLRTSLKVDTASLATLFFKDSRLSGYAVVSL